MPSAAPKPCTQPGCPALVSKGSRCPAHQRAGWQDHQARKDYDRRRGTAHQRGYTSRWRRIRNAYIAAEPLCEWCKSVGMVTRATEVDHVVPLSQGGAIDGVLQSLCHPCHVAKTKADEARGKGRANGPGPRSGLRRPKVPQNGP